MGVRRTVFPSRPDFATNIFFRPDEAPYKRACPPADSCQPCGTQDMESSTYSVCWYNSMCECTVH
jgi:hypothetical protein